MNYLAWVVLGLIVTVLLCGAGVLIWDHMRYKREARHRAKHGW